MAAEHGQEVVVQALFNLGADFNKATDDGATPLFIAAKNGHEAIVQILRDARDA